MAERDDVPAVEEVETGAAMEEGTEEEDQGEPRSETED